MPGCTKAKRCREAGRAALRWVADGGAQAAVAVGGPRARALASPRSPCLSPRLESAPGVTPTLLANLLNARAATDRAMTKAS